MMRRVAAAAMALASLGAIVAFVMVFTGLLAIGAFESDLIVTNPRINWSVFGPIVLIESIVAVFLAMLIIRVGARALPLRASGRVDAGASITLVAILAIVILTFTASAWLVHESFPLRDDEVWQEKEDFVRDGDGWRHIDFPRQDGMWANARRLAAWGSINVGILWGIALVLPIILLLWTHLRSRHVTSRPFVLFLRRFSGVSNSAALAAR